MDAGLNNNLIAREFSYIKKIILGFAHPIPFKKNQKINLANRFLCLTIQWGYSVAFSVEQ